MDIIPIIVDGRKPVGDICMLDREAEGIKICYHSIHKGTQMVFDPCKNSVRILFLCKGSVSLQNCSKNCEIDGRGVFIGKPRAATQLICRENAELLELVRYLSKQEWELENSDSKLPFFQKYNSAQKYLEEGKSSKTINRMIVPQRLIPRFAMGSVETHGEDRVAEHRHPMLDQYFFSLAENDCFVLIGNRRYPYKGNSLLHIPLGSDHGILSEEGQIIHYIWMDFLLGEDGLQYMDETHHMI